VRLTDEEKAAIRARPFPLQAADRRYPRAAAPLAIPWSVAEKAFGAYAARYGTDQSPERTAQRGGFGVEEMDEFYPPWRDEVSEIASLLARLSDLEAERDAATQRAAEMEREAARLRETLRIHWLAGIECDHETKRDRPSCACAAVDLGWHSSVGAAVDAWLAHVLSEATPSPPPAEDGKETK
jgi:hypothetical protein